MNKAVDMNKVYNEIKALASRHNSEVVDTHDKAVCRHSREPGCGESYNFTNESEYRVVME